MQQNDNQSSNVALTDAMFHKLTFTISSPMVHSPTHVMFYKLMVIINNQPLTNAMFHRTSVTNSYLYIGIYLQPLIFIPLSNKTHNKGHS